MVYFVFFSPTLVMAQGLAPKTSWEIPSRRYYPVLRHTSGFQGLGLRGGWWSGPCLSLAYSYYLHRDWYVTIGLGVHRLQTSASFTGYFFCQPLVGGTCWEWKQQFYFNGLTGLYVAYARPGKDWTKGGAKWQVGMLLGLEVEYYLSKYLVVVPRAGTRLLWVGKDDLWRFFVELGLKWTW